MGSRSDKVTVVIPARYGSSRFPGKPLADIAGKPMVVRVAEQAAKSGAREVIVATDHAAIKKAVEAHGFEAEMTRKDHATGTDRLAEVGGGGATPSCGTVSITLTRNGSRIGAPLIRALPATATTTP